jgi:hypothetical protein
VALRSADRKYQRVGNLGQAETLTDQRQHFHLAWGERSNTVEFDVFASRVTDKI